MINQQPQQTLPLQMTSTDMNNLLSYINLPQANAQSPNYWGTYTSPIQIGMPTPTPVPQYDTRGRLIKAKNKNLQSFENPSALPLYSMYIPPSSMPNINAYLQSPTSLLGAMQSANVAPQGAGQYLTSNTSTGQ